MPSDELAAVELDGGGTATIRRLAALVAAASVLQVAESLLPHPLPGVRLGLANVMTLVAMVGLGAQAAIALTVVRTLVSAILLGTLFAPAFWLSFAGGFASTSVMAGLYLWSRRFPAVGFGLVGISVAGAVTHIMVQVALVYLVFVRNAGVLLLWPWLGLAAAAAGVLTGLVAAQAIEQLQAGAQDKLATAATVAANKPDAAERPLPGRAWTTTGARYWAERIAPKWKIVLVLALGIGVVVWENYVFYLLVLMLILGLAFAAGIKAGPLWRNVGRLWPLALFALVVPLLFTTTGRVLLVLGSWRLTADGLRQGLVFVWRLVLLYSATTLLAATTRPGRLAAGLGRLLGPLRWFGIRPGRLGTLLVLAWDVFGWLWAEAGSIIRALGRATTPAGFIRIPGAVVARLYWLALARTR